MNLSTHSCLVIAVLLQQPISAFCSLPCSVPRFLSCVQTLAAGSPLDSFSPAAASTSPDAQAASLAANAMAIAARDPTRAHARSRSMTLPSTGAVAGIRSGRSAQQV